MVINYNESTGLLMSCELCILLMTGCPNFNRSKFRKSKCGIVQKICKNNLWLGYNFYHLQLLKNCWSTQHIFKKNFKVKFWSSDPGCRYYLPYLVIGLNGLWMVGNGLVETDWWWMMRDPPFLWPHPPSDGYPAEAPQVQLWWAQIWKTENKPDVSYRLATSQLHR